MFQTGSPGIEIRRYYEMKIENLFLSQSRPRGGRNPRPASASVRFEQKFIGPPSKSVLEADEIPRPASASVRFGRKLIGPPSASVLEADGFKENILSGIRLRARTAVPVPRPLVQSRSRLSHTVWIILGLLRAKKWQKDELVPESGFFLNWLSMLDSFFLNQQLDPTTTS